MRLNKSELRSMSKVALKRYLKKEKQILCPEDYSELLTETVLMAFKIAEEDKSPQELALIVSEAADILFPPISALYN
jgi:hypothetical protein